MSNVPPLNDGTVIEQINKDDLQAMYDTDHAHIYELDPDDITDDYYAEVCTVKNCNVGRLVSKH